MHDTARNTRCHRCGSQLGMGRTVLIEQGFHAGEIARDPARALGLLRQQLGRGRSGGGGLLHRLLLRLREIASGPPGRGWYGYAPLSDDERSYDTFCQRCGEHSTGGRATAYHAGGAPYEDAEGRIDMPRLLASAAFAVYGLKGSPLGLRLRGVGWGAGGGRRSVDHVSFTYVAEGPNQRRRAVELSQGIDVAGRSAEGRLSGEMRQVIGLVMGYGPQELRREYLQRGNVHRDWNLERMSRAERRRLTITINEAPAEVELAHWWEPELIVLAHVTLDGHSVLATSVGITHIELLALLKTMTALRGDPEALAEHEEGYEEARRPRTG